MFTQLDTTEFSLDSGLIYLDHARVAPWPRRTVEAVQRFAEDMQQGARYSSRWHAVENHLREQGRALLNAPAAADIALLKNTSEALSVVAHGLPWQTGDNVVITNREFPSNRIVWESLRPAGVTVREADLAVAPEDALFALTDKQTRLIAVSAVQYADGLRLDLEKIGAFCRERGILLCVDAIQHLGALPFDVQAVQADFVMADGHKWLLAAEGLALFYCRAECREQLQLHQFGWHMVEDIDFERRDWTPAASARRFECGSSNTPGIHALSASLSLFEDIGMAQVSAQVLDNTAYLLAALDRIPDIEILSPQDPARYSGIVTFRHRRLSVPALHQALLARNVFCAMRGGGIRFSPHFYTPRAHLDAAVAFLSEKIVY